MNNPDTHHHTPWNVYSTHAIFETGVAPIWDLLADFNGLPALLSEAVSSSVEGEGVGMVRTVTLDDGKKMHESLIGIHHDVFRLSYAMRDPSPFPWKHYFCTQQLQSLGGGETHFLCTGYYQLSGATDAEIRSLLQPAYHSIFQGIARVLGVKLAIQP